MRRLDKDVSRPKALEEGTEQGWLKRRRAAVDDSLLEVASCEEGDVASTPPDLWTESHEKEFQKQRKKQTRHAVEALWDGRLLPAEITDDLNNVAEAQTAKNLAQDKLLRQNYKRAARRQQMLDQKFDWQHLSGCKYWSHPTHTHAKLGRCMMDLNLQPVDERQEADVYVVRNAAEPGERVQWFAVLGGKVVLEEKFALNEASGLVMHYKAILARGKHRLYMTQAFISKHTVISNIIQVLMQPGQSFKASWKLSARADADVLLGTSEEVQSQARGERWFDKRSFLKKFLCLDVPLMQVIR